MILTLEVMGEQAAQLGAGRRKVFNAIGGTIGRLPDNDWVLPDPYVSGRHALIRYLNGRFFVEDTSTNGVFINAPDSRLSRTQAHPLKQGDVLYIDASEISVAIERDVAAERERSASDPLAVLQEHAGQRGPRAGRRDEPVGSIEEEDHTESMAVSPDAADEDRRAGNETEWFGLSEASLPQPAPAVAAQPRPRAALRVAAEPRVAAPAKSSANPRATPKAVSGDEDLFALMLEAAGVSDIEPSEQLARACGDILRTAVSGLMEVLHSREQMKETLRIRSTTFKPANNNPLKFSANADDAFHNLLGRQSAAYLEPAEAFNEALNDVRDHQVAVQAAIRLAFETMLAQFDPNRLAEEFDRHMKKGSILGVPAKLRYWDLYREKYGDMIKDAEGSFRTLFGNEFAKAYEEQVERLKGRSRR
jgi:type VI secretion system FHA domain protein